MDWVVDSSINSSPVYSKRFYLFEIRSQIYNNGHRSNTGKN